MMRNIILLGTALLLMPPATTLHAQAPSDRRPSIDQEIAEVRGIYQDIVREAAAKRIVPLDTVPHCQGGHDGVSTRIWRDRGGRLRKLEWHGHTEHHGDERHYYYDTSGNLRFSLVKWAADNSTSEEERTYYAADGRQLRQLSQTTGPGYPFHREEPIWEPERWLRWPCAADGQHRLM